VIAPTGVGIVVIGTLDATPFERLSVEHGETIWDFLERIARPRGIIMGSDHYGNFLLIGDHVTVPADILTDALTGGDNFKNNIKRMNSIIAVKNIYSEYRIDGQSAATDSMNGTDASEQTASVPGTATRYSPLLTPAEQPVWGISELQMRAMHEAVWHEGTIVQATVEVQGWMRPSGGLWQPGATVTVKAPMAMTTWS
jgi:prophage tail gpP-like protein